MTKGWKVVQFKWHLFDERGVSACGRWTRSILGNGVERRKPRLSVPKDDVWPVCDGCKVTAGGKHGR
jgi:hypothetical protein